MEVGLHDCDDKLQKLGYRAYQYRDIKDVSGLVQTAPPNSLGLMKHDSEPRPTEKSIFREF